MTFNAVTLDATLQVTKYGTSDFETDGTFNNATETYHTDVGPLIPNVPLKYTKVSSGVLAEMTDPEKAVVDASELDKSEKENISEGFNSLGSITTGTRNIGFGNNSLAQITTGTKNLGLGDFSGSNLTGNDGSNVMIANMGVSGDTKAIRIGTSGIHNFTSLVGSLNLVDEQYETPTSGATVTISDNASIIIIEPAGLLITLTINMPSAPRDGQLIKLLITQTITTLTMNGNGNTLLGSIAGSIPALTRGSWYYREASTTWYPI